MRRVVIILCVLVLNVLSSFAQNKRILETAEVEKVLAVYKSEVKPYLKVMAEKEYPQGDKSTMRARYARFLVLEVYHLAVKEDVYKALEMTEKMESVPKSRLDSIPYIDVLVKRAYSMHYTGLPYEFYKKASDMAKEN